MVSFLCLLLYNKKTSIDDFINVVDLVLIIEISKLNKNCFIWVY